LKRRGYQIRSEFEVFWHNQQHFKPPEVLVLPAYQWVKAGTHSSPHPWGVRGDSSGETYTNFNL